MDFEATFPRRYYLNLDRRPDRRNAVEKHFAKRGLVVERASAVDGSKVRNLRGFENEGKCAHSLTTRMLLRKAIAEGAPSLFLFEDDVLLREDFREILAEIQLPDNWAMFYLGGQHKWRPYVVSKHLVRAKRLLDTHAWGCNGKYFRQILSKLHDLTPGPRDARMATDLALSHLHMEIPVYAVFPNLAWQSASPSNIVDREETNYEENVHQRHGAEILDGLAERARNAD